MDLDDIRKLHAAQRDNSYIGDSPRLGAFWSRDAMAVVLAALDRTQHWLDEFQGAASVQTLRAVKAEQALDTATARAAGLEKELAKRDSEIAAYFEGLRWMVDENGWRGTYYGTPPTPAVIDVTTDWCNPQALPPVSEGARRIVAEHDALAALALAAGEGEP